VTSGGLSHHEHRHEALLEEGELNDAVADQPRGSVGHQDGPVATPTFDAATPGEIPPTLHTYYVVAGNASVLVHNSNGLLALSNFQRGVQRSQSVSTRRWHRDPENGICFRWSDSRYPAW
jgi:hypothetical protein